MNIFKNLYSYKICIIKIIFEKFLFRIKFSIDPQGVELFFNTHPQDYKESQDIRNNLFRIIYHPL